MPRRGALIRIAPKLRFLLRKLPLSIFPSSLTMQPDKTTDTTTEEADQLQHSKEKIRNDEGNFQGATSRVPTMEPWMLDKTEYLNENGRRRTYADLVIHGTLEPQSDSDEDSKEGGEDEFEDMDSERPMDWLEMS
ncbi:hypothetical protein PIB30_096199 [Stylosanthes scabra]|uniref:Uncharacterized protein n=1 Tax=Stylosanthes scabra TaxID=79078 RepID=A0ABU6SX82_9FABA|nr:hypothetical protein [Stylosanthes scabra]